MVRSAPCFLRLCTANPVSGLGSLNITILINLQRRRGRLSLTDRRLISTTVRTELLETILVPHGIARWEAQEAAAAACTFLKLPLAAQTMRPGIPEHATGDSNRWACRRRPFRPLITNLSSKQAIQNGTDRAYSSSHISCFITGRRSPRHEHCLILVASIGH